MTQSEACRTDACDDCRRPDCDCACHVDVERTYGGYATQDEYYAEWGE